MFRMNFSQKNPRHYNETLKMLENDVPLDVLFLKLTYDARQKGGSDTENRSEKKTVFRVVIGFKNHYLTISLRNNIDLINSLDH